MSDFRRLLEGAGANAGASSITASVAVVGHSTPNPAYARVENGRVLVEVTLRPSGREVVAVLGDQGGGGGFAFFLPVWIGMRVLVVQAADTMVIVSKVTDEAWPLSSDVDDLDLPAAPVEGGEVPAPVPAPAFAFVRTPEGALLAIESGEDLLLRAKGSVRVRVDEGEQILLRGRTHIGEGVDFASPPVPAVVGATGLEGGTGGGAFVPTPNTNPVTPPAVDEEGPLPANGIVRLKDAIQANTATSPLFFVWMDIVTTAITVMAAQFNLAPPGTPLTSLGTGSVTPPVAVPETVESLPRTASANTCGDT